MDPSRCLTAGIDVGKYEALCLVADHRGELVGQPLTFPLTEVGARALERQLAAASASREALSVRVGVETAGHYHRTIVSRLVAAGHDVLELNQHTSKRCGRSRDPGASRPICGMPLPSSTC